LWEAGEINGESNLFVTERDDHDKVKCVNIKAENIRHNLETGAEIDLESLRPPEGLVTKILMRLKPYSLTQQLRPS
jgi:hypothetical protein